MFGDEEEKKHESYGMISVNRVTASPPVRLFGAHVPSASYIRITISEGVQLIRDGGREWYHSGKTLTELEVSESQWATMVSSFNHGDGTPCTVIFHNGKKERVPEAPVQTERYQHAFKKKCEALDNKLKDGSEAIDTILEKKSLTKADKKVIKDHLRAVHMEVRENFPFLLTQFQESVAKTATSMKQDVEGWVSGLVRGAGLEAIAGGKLKLFKDNND